MQRRIFVFGAKGQVGRAIIRQAGEAATGFDRASVDISEATSVRRAVLKHPPSAIVNAAGYTAVDQAETDIDAALRANRDGAAVLAEAASSAKVPLVQISTDYVFDGARRTPYREDDPVAPLNVELGEQEAGERLGAEQHLPTPSHPAHVLGVQPRWHELRSHHAAAWHRAQGTRGGR